LWFRAAFVRGRLWPAVAAVKRPAWRLAVKTGSW